jgi:hypothetical protein
VYGKLFAQMYDGTLATRGPWQALVTFQQMIVLADKHGEVDMTIEAISRRTTIPVDIIETGVRELLLPDEHSRSPDENGCRLVPIDDGRPWGWRVVNYGHYRKIRSEEDRREYHKLYARERRAKSTKTSTNINTSTDSQQNQPIAVSSKQKELKSKTEQEHVPQAARFDEFWSVYPIKRGKKTARDKWVQKRLDGKADELIADVCKRLVSDRQWLDGFAPHAATYLHQERWQDEMAGREQTRQPSGTPQSKTMQAIQNAQRMKGNGTTTTVVSGGDSGRDNTPALLELGRPTSR